MSEFFKTSIALIVISSRFPIGVETIYKVFYLKFHFMKKKFNFNILYNIFFNSNLFSRKNKILKVGLLAPFKWNIKN